MQEYDHRVLLREILNSYVSPVATMPEEQIEAYLEAQTAALAEMTADNFPGDELTPEQFAAGIRLDMDREAARKR